MGATRVQAGFPSPIEVTMGEEMIPRMAEPSGKDRRMRRVDGGMVTEDGIPMDVSVPVKRGEREVTLRLGTVARLDADVALLLAHLGPRQPRGSRRVENVVEKTGC